MPKKAEVGQENGTAYNAKSRIIALCLVGALILGAIVISIVSIVKYLNDEFDYLTADLDEYVYLAEEDYRGYELLLDIAKPHDIDVDVVMLNLRASRANKDYPDPVGDGSYIRSDHVLGAGDKVYIYYRGYLKDKDGNTVEASGMCNYTGESASELTLGSGQFVPGFELGLVDKNIDEFPKFEKITTDKVTEDMVVYVSYTRTPAGSTSKDDEVKVSGKRVDLADASALNSLGENFKDYIVGWEIGEKRGISGIKVGNKTYDYKDFKVDFATTCEKESTNDGVAIQTVKCYFPYDYGNDGTSQAKLRNETAYFEVYVEKVQDYKADELNDDFIKKIVGEPESPITEAELRAKYEGADLVEKYKKYVKDYLDELYEEEYRSMVEDAMWERYLAKAQFKKYPENKVKPIYDEYVADVHYQFEQTGGQIKDPTSLTGEYKLYEDIDSFAIAYLNLTYSQNKDWKSVLYTMSQSLVGERLILYYLIDKLNIEITPELLEATKAEVKQEYLDEYIKQSLEYEKNQDPTNFKKPEGDAYNKYVEDRSKELFEYYDDAYFTETAYYEIALDVFITLPVVKTLDVRNAYPYPTIS